MFIKIERSFIKNGPPVSRASGRVDATIVSAESNISAESNMNCFLHFNNLHDFVLTVRKESDDPKQKYYLGPVPPTPERSGNLFAPMLLAQPMLHLDGGSDAIGNTSSNDEGDVFQEATARVR